MGSPSSETSIGLIDNASSHNSINRDKMPKGNFLIGNMEEFGLLLRDWLVEFDLTISVDEREPGGLLGLLGRLGLLGVLGKGMPL